MTPFHPSEPADPVEACLAALAREVDRDPGLSRELEESWDEFCPGVPRPAAGAPAGSESELALRRHLEWFLLEKSRLGPRESRIDELIARCARAEGESPEEIAETLAGSHASVFEVVGVEPGSRLVLWDLAGLFECTADEASASLVLEPGDLIAGRVFPVADSLYRLSPAAAMWRDPKLLAAFKKDLDRARASRPAVQRGNLRLGQAAIEAMFHVAPTGSRVLSAPAEPGDAGKNAVATARALLAEEGVEPDEIETMLARLAEEPPPERPVLPGSGDVLGEILEELAFESSVDLEAARRALLLAWAELHAQESASAAPVPPGAPAETVPSRADADVAAAVAEFDRKRREGAPLEAVFQGLEKDLGVADLEADEEDSPAPDFPGVVGAMIEEFLWDEGREHGPEAARRFAGLRSLGRFAESIGVFENFTGRELAAYACRWLPESREVKDARAARDLLDGIARFCDWSQENHEVKLAEQFAPVLRSLEESLPRLVEANGLCAPAGPREDDLWLEFVAPADGAGAEMRDRSGAAVTLALEPRVEPYLRAGDLVRGRMAGQGRLAVSTCFPGEVRDLELA